MDRINISLWVTDGCLSSAVLTLMDTFTIANHWYYYLNKQKTDALFNAHIVSTKGEPVTASGNVRLTPELALEDIAQTDCVVVSPMLPHVDAMPRDITLLGSWLKKMKADGTVIASVCTGSFILAQAGLLDGKKATTNWHFAKLFNRRYPGVRLLPEDIIVEDDAVITTGAATAVNNLAIHLIRRFGSRELASVCAKALLIDASRLTQSPYSMSTPFYGHGDNQVLKAQELIENDYARIACIDDIARDVGISPRHFKRRFKKATGDLPIKYLQKVRIEAAKEQLETTAGSLEQITLAVGYKDVSSFCRLFKQHTRTSPKNYREKFYCRIQA